jgi:hypothetical protein
MREEIGGNWAREPQLWTEQLNSVRGLNLRFLDLASAGADHWQAAHSSGGTLLSIGDANLLASLSMLQRAAVASCPYALFDLRFEDEAYWTSRLSRTVQYRVADEPHDEALTDFVRLAVFYAWHLARTASLAAQFLLGMSAVTVESFRTLDVNGLPALAAGEVSNLSARWSHSAAYWSALISAAARADSQALRRIQLHGLQLAAAARLP